MLQAQLIDQLFVIAGAGFGHVSVIWFVTLALRTGIDSDDVIVFREFVDLLLPDPRRHGPAWNEYDGVAAARLEIVDADAVGGFDEAVLRSRCLGEDARR